MLAKTQKSAPVQSRNCLGCADCKGLCHALVDLALLPEVVLQRSERGS